jgi:hypothetical protein
MLECAKFAYKGRKLHIQYITDDISQYLEIDGDEFREIDYGLTIEDAPDYNQIKSTMFSLAQAGLQNDKTNFSMVMDILTDPSIASVRRKIEDAEIEKQDRDRQAAQSEQEHQKALQQEMLNAKQASEETKAALAQLLEKVRIDGKISLEKVKAVLTKNEIDPNTVAKIEADLEMQDKQLQHETSENAKDRALEASEGSKDRHAKPKTTSK